MWLLLQAELDAAQGHMAEAAGEIEQLRRQQQEEHDSFEAGLHRWGEEGCAGLARANVQCAVHCTLTVVSPGQSSGRHGGDEYLCMLQPMLVLPPCPVHYRARTEAVEGAEVARQESLTALKSELTELKVR